MFLPCRRKFITDHFQKYKQSSSQSGSTPLTLSDFETYLGKTTFFSYLTPSQRQVLGNYIRGHQQTRQPQSISAASEPQQSPGQQNTSLLIKEFIRLVHEFLDLLDANIADMSKENEDKINILLNFLFDDGFDDDEEISDILQKYNLTRIYTEIRKYIKQDKFGDNYSQDDERLLERQFQSSARRIGAIHTRLEELREAQQRAKQQQFQQYDRKKTKISKPQQLRQQTQQRQQPYVIPHELRNILRRDPSRKSGHPNERYIVDRTKLQDEQTLTIGGRRYTVKFNRQRNQIQFHPANMRGQFDYLSTYNCRNTGLDYLAIDKFCTLIDTPLYFPDTDKPFIWTRVNNCIDEPDSTNINYLVNMKSPVLYSLPSHYQLYVFDTFSTKKDKDGFIVHSLHDLKGWLARTRSTDFQFRFVCDAIKANILIVPARGGDITYHIDGEDMTLPLLLVRPKQYYDLMYIKVNLPDPQSLPTRIRFPTNQQRDIARELGWDGTDGVLSPEKKKQIQKAFRKISLKMHPDRPGGGGNAQLFRKYNSVKDKLLL